MNTHYRRVQISLVLVIIFLCCNPLVFAKKRCKALQKELHLIQAQQRKGYSLQRGVSLRAREDKAREKWWQCEHPSYGRKKTVKKKTKNRKREKPTQQSTLDSAKSQRNMTNELEGKRVTAPFISLESIVVNSTYQGEKLFAWLRFYQQPAQCYRPNNLSVFAFCSENKQAQKIDFEQGYLAQKK